MYVCLFEFVCTICFQVSEEARRRLCSTGYELFSVGAGTVFRSSARAISTAEHLSNTHLRVFCLRICP